jgi:hypothetical protein
MAAIDFLVARRISVSAGRARRKWSQEVPLVETRASDKGTTAKAQEKQQAVLLPRFSNRVRSSNAPKRLEFLLVQDPLECPRAPVMQPAPSGSVDRTPGNHNCFATFQLVMRC